MKFSDIFTSAWQSEVNGLGYCYRYVGLIPMWLPLPFMGQHGAQFNLGLPLFDQPNHYPVYVSWHLCCVDLLKAKYAKDARGICNPICAYFRCKNITVTSEAKGTIHFLSHNGTDFNRGLTNIDDLFAELDKLDESHKPVTVCLHPNDYEQLAPLCEEAGFRCVTNASPSSKVFVENLIFNITRHKFVSGGINQSAVMYAIDFGLDWIGDCGDEINATFIDVIDTDYVGDLYAKSVCAMLARFVGQQGGNEKIRSVVRGHLGISEYKGRLMYMLQLWSYYFDSRVIRIIARNFVNYVKRTAGKSRTT
jgi:hypothetical protein